MTLSELEKEGIESLRGAMVPDSAYDARELLLFASTLSLTKYLTFQDAPVSPGLIDKYRDLIRQRCERIPLQHIIGETEFMGLKFYVNEHVLCPRPDTEILVETVVDHVKNHFRSMDPDSNVRILDLCTGSGCILISIMRLGAEAAGVKRSRMKGVGCDISAEALDVASRNAWRCGIESENVLWKQGDLFEAIADEELFDIIVSNPPYIPSRYIDELMPEVRDHEPHSALDGGEEGLHFYKKITQEAPKYLKEGGFLFYEIGYDQREDVSMIMKEKGFKNIECKRDLSQNDRVVFGQL